MFSDGAEAMTVSSNAYAFCFDPPHKSPCQEARAYESKHNDSYCDCLGGPSDCSKT